MPQNPDTTIMDFYNGVDGQTLHIEVHSLQRLREIRNIVTSLKDGTISEFQTARMENVKQTNFHNLIMRNTTSQELFFFHSIRQYHTAHGLDILWIATNDGWDNVEGLIDGLIDSEGDGHLYFYNEENGDKGVMIELYKVFDAC